VIKIIVTQMDSPTISSIIAVPPHLCSHPLREGNYVKPIIDSLPTYLRICEVIEAAQKSVWIICSFINLDTFVFPNGQNFFTYMNAVCDRGLDVRVLFWRNNRFFKSSKCEGLPDEIQRFKDFCPNIKIRWDDSLGDGAHCHHEKSWFIDCGQPTEVTFTGGITLSDNLHPTSHTDSHSTHDIFCEIRGPGN